MILSLGVGVGLNSSLAGLVRAAVYPTFPYDSLDRLVVISETKKSSASTFRVGLTLEEFLVWRDESQCFQHLAIAQYQTRYGIAGLGQPEIVDGRKVSEDFFAVLGAAPARGRLFAPTDSGQSLIVLSYDFWATRTGKSLSALGSVLQIDGEPFEVVGVLPKDFHFLFGGNDIWLLAQGDDLRSVNHQQRVVGRLREGLTVAQAERRLESLHMHFDSRHDEPREILLEPIADFYRRTRVVSSDLAQRLLLAYALMLIVLLLASSNVLSLLFARMVSRLGEFSLRSALGASRRQLGMLVATEGGVVAALGGGAGVFLSWILLRVFAVGWANALPGGTAKLGWQEVALAFVLSLGAGILLTSSVAVLTARLSAGARVGQTAPDYRGRTGSILLRGVLLLQIIIACSLLTATSVLAKSFVSLLAIDPGFNSENVLFAELRLPEARYVVTNPETGERRISRRQEAFLREVTRELQACPEIEVVGASNDLMSQAVIVYQIEGHPGEDPIPTVALYRPVTPGFFKAMGVSLFKGRLFSRQEHTPSSAEVIIINSRASRVLWPAETPIGRLLIQWKGSSTPRRIVGVVADTRHAILDQRPKTTFYVPYDQLSFDYDSPGRLRLNIMLVVRHRGAADKAAAAVRKAVYRTDPQLPLYSLQTAEERFKDQLSERSLLLTVLLLLASVSLILVLTGIVGLTSALLRRRRLEMGVRMALGASEAKITSLLLRPSLQLALAGSALGVWGGYALSALLRDFLYGTEPLDFGIYLGVCGLLIALILLCAYSAARRAKRIDPSNLLRTE